MQIKALSVDEAIARDIDVNFEVLLPAHAWDELEERLTKLRDEAIDQPSQSTYNTAISHFSTCAIIFGPSILDELRLWQQAYPASTFPALLEVLYWAKWFGEYRGEGVASEVTSTMWECAHWAQDVMFCALVRLLDRDKNAWVVISKIIYSVAAVGEPDWWQKWLLEGTRPTLVPIDDVSDELAAMLARSGGEAAASKMLYDDLPDRLPDVLTGEALSWLRKNQQSHGGSLQYWLRVAFAMDPFALDVACTYVTFLMPRWGGSIEAMLAFADSSLCERYNENDRNILRYFAWFDELEVDGYMLEDPRVVKNQLRIGERLLKRPLPENLRGRVHKYVAYLFLMLGRFDDACKHYSLSAPHNNFEEWEIVRAIEVWVASKDKGPWLGQIANLNCLVTPRGAALYGFLCSTGLGGVEKRPEVVEEWYERAARPVTNLTDVRLSPFNALYGFADLEGDDLLLPMWLKAADLGDVSSQFCVGCYFEGKDNYARRVKFFKQAADCNHPQAMYNVIFNQLEALADGELSSAEADQAINDVLLYLDKANEFFPCLIDEHPDALHLDTWRRVKAAHGWILRSSSFPLGLRQHVLPQALAYANDGAANCMVGLGWWYSDKNAGSYNYLEAVRWTEAARLVNPDQEFLEELFDKLEGASFWSIFKYGLARRKVQREGLPGQVD